MVAADFNGDGARDLAVANRDSDSVSIVMGTAAGGFLPAATYAVGSMPVAVAAGDLNGDGAPDLAVADSTDDTISVLLNNGDGTFQPAVQYATGDYAAAVLVADFDEDGRADLAVANNVSSTVGILLGNGDGTFRTPVTYAVGAAGTNPFSLAAADFNGDGHADLVAANFGSSGPAAGMVSLLLGNGDGTFQPRAYVPVGGSPYAVAAGDVNGDGKADLVTADSPHGTVSVLLGTGTGAFRPAVSYAVGAAPLALALGDFNADARPDLAVADFGTSGTATGSGVSVLLNDGSGGFLPATTFAAGTNPSAIVAEDFNRDAAPDLAVANEGSDDVSLLLNIPAPPTLNGVSPASGPVAGGTTVTLSGAAFAGGATVTFGGTGCLDIRVVAASTITCVTPPHPAGTVAVVVTNPDGQRSATPVNFTYVGAPTIRGLTPTTGPTGGGTPVTIGGAGFQPGATVTFGSASCASVTVVSSLTITCLTPSRAAGSVLVTVINPDGQRSGERVEYTYEPPPPASPTFAPWTAQGGILTDAPAAAGFNGRIYAFAKGTDAALYAKSSADGATWTNWQRLGGLLTAAPAAASHDGRLYAFARGSDNALYVMHSADGVTWGGWTRLGGVLTASPAATSVNGVLYVFAKGSDNALYMMRSADGANWSTWQNLGGALTAAPAAAGFRGQVYVFARGSDDALYERHSAGGAIFTGWRNDGGVLTAAPAAASYTPAGGTETLYTFAAGTDHTLFERHTTDGAGWTGWQSLGGQLVGAPAAAGVNGTLYAFVRWVDNALWERHTLP